MEIADATVPLVDGKMDPAAVQHARLQVDIRKLWLMKVPMGREMMLPKMWPKLMVSEMMLPEMVLEVMGVNLMGTKVMRFSAAGIH